MSKNSFFFNLSDQLSGWRLVIISILMLVGAGVLYYFNQLGQALQDRETKYATLYAESVRFFIEQGLDSPCDYTFVSEVIGANESIPAILVSEGEAINAVNIAELTDSTRTFTEEERKKFLDEKILAMAAEHEPIEIDLLEGQRGYLYYSSSSTLKELKFFPYILLATFLVFGTLAFIAYSSSRKAEENRVWVGLAKETAHQLGTPISGLLGWIAVLREFDGFDQSIGDEMEKDVYRLETITTRFSNIGSVPTMKEENIGKVVEETTLYLRRRISTKIEWFVANTLSPDINNKINRHLFEWVIENLCKNAVDSMAGVGELYVTIYEKPNGKVQIDIRDTGKGISNANQRKIFRPGFSTKKRGWGLGLTLAKRIIETYHGGKLFIKQSELDKGTTFGIIV
ncbi:ATP-binding protein [Arcticibacterium luteifluviistationis]|uniref:histidine kinase n=1 Tax=Arcticibacterium luteifluviistationis TaxID=1784714 RepID=A0A2Z4G9R8_9BACT|nr:ATP-binding protein [Arcticibacterium luteifluviistationis]AWV97808.1 histidine kinase [Arcticibacterium luteifluviistationis]